MKPDKYKDIVDALYRHCLTRKKGDFVPWDEVEGVMGKSRNDRGGRQIVRRLIRDILKRRRITCMVEPEAGIRFLTDMEAAIEVPKMRQKRAKKQIRKGLRETEHVDRQNLTERAMVNLAFQRRAMAEEQKQIARSIKEVSILLRPSRRD